MTLSTLHLSVLLPLFTLVTYAALTDVKRRRIPNWLTGTGILIAFAVHLALAGLPGIRFAAQGMLIAFALYLVLYLLRALGAGDVKLMAAVGAFSGYAIWLDIFFATALIGALVALFQVLTKRKLIEVLANMGTIVLELFHLRAPYRANTALDVRSPAAFTLPHGIAIAAGVFVLFLSRS